MAKLAKGQKTQNYVLRLKPERTHKYDDGNVASYYADIVAAEPQPEGVSPFYSHNIRYNHTQIDAAKAVGAVHEINGKTYIGLNGELGIFDQTKKNPETGEIEKTGVRRVQAIIGKDANGAHPYTAMEGFDQAYAESIAKSCDEYDALKMAEAQARKAEATVEAPAPEEAAAKPKKPRTRKAAAAPEVAEAGKEAEAEVSGADMDF